MYYQPLGSHPTVTRFLKWVFESKPTALGYTRQWDVSKVLCYLGTIYNSEDLSLWDVSLKTVPASHIITYSALNLLTKRYNTYSTDKYKSNTIF